jgi:hypothetical protein
MQPSLAGSRSSWASTVALVEQAGWPPAEDESKRYNIKGFAHWLKRTFLAAKRAWLQLARRQSPGFSQRSRHAKPWPAGCVPYGAASAPISLPEYAAGG